MPRNILYQIQMAKNENEQVHGIDKLNLWV